jgi:hypothetical protein
VKQISCIQTSDGALHTNIDAAIRHAEARYADALSKIAHELALNGNGKYKTTGDYIDANLGKFADLMALKADIVFCAEDETGD